MDVTYNIFNSNWIITYSTLAVAILLFALIIILFLIIRRKKSFELVKAEISIMNPKFYFELNKDKDRELLILENGELREKIKALNKKNNQLSFVTFLILILTLFSNKLKSTKVNSKFNKQK